jgi:hypothetical protein
MEQLPKDEQLDSNSGRANAGTQGSSEISATSVQNGQQKGDGVESALRGR